MILADQCVYRTTLEFLRNHGFDVVTLREVGSPTAADEDVLALAGNLDRVLLTNDKDFSDILTYPPAAHRGVIVLRMSATEESDTHQVLVSLLKHHPPVMLTGTLAIVDARKYRLRR